MFVTPFILILQMFELTRPSQRYQGPGMEFKEAFSDSHACDYNSGPRGSLPAAKDSLLASDTGRHVKTVYKALCPTGQR